MCIICQCTYTQKFCSIFLFSTKYGPEQVSQTLFGWLASLNCRIVKILSVHLLVIGSNNINIGDNLSPPFRDIVLLNLHHGQTDRLIDRQTDGWMEGYFFRSFCIQLLILLLNFIYIYQAFTYINQAFTFSNPISSLCMDRCYYG